MSEARHPITYPLHVPNSRTVSLVTLGCARNEVDSEELAARLAAGGWTLRGEGEDADVVLVNTCGFIQAAKQESIDELLAAADSGAKVAAVGCLAERYGTELGRASCPKPRSSASTTTPTSPRGSTTCWPAASGPRTWPGTGARCCRSARRAVRRPREPTAQLTVT